MYCLNIHNITQTFSVSWDTDGTSISGLLVGNSTVRCQMCRAKKPESATVSDAELDKAVRFLQEQKSHEINDIPGIIKAYETVRCREVAYNPTLPDRLIPPEARKPKLKIMLMTYKKAWKTHLGKVRVSLDV